MPRACSICTHPRRLEIDRALTEMSDSNRRIASRYDVSERAIRDQMMIDQRGDAIAAVKADGRYSI